MFKIRESHEKYGLVIRMNLYELHVIVPEFMDVIYTGYNHKRDKWSFYTEIFAIPGASMNTNAHDHHRIRRSALNPFFSKASIRNMQPLIDAKVDQLLERFDDFQKSGDVLTLNHATAAFTNDVVTEFSFGKCYNRLGDPKFDPSFHDNARGGADMVPFLAFFPIIMRTLEALPQALTSRLSSEYERFLGEKNDIFAEAKNVIQSPKASFEDRQHRTIFHEILDSKLPLEEKSIDRLADEAGVTLAAGTLTTAWVLAVAIYYMVANPTLLRKLKTELEAAIPDPSSHTPLATLDTLPYLRAVVQESIRLGYGAPGRVCHIAPDEAMVVPGANSLPIPPGTPTCMTVYLMHHIESIFPDSHTFRPERWIENQRLDKHLFAFSKGSRGCAGINLAYAELTIAVARIFRNYGTTECRFDGDKGVLELFKTDQRDVVLVAAMVLTKVWSGTKGVRMCVRM
ncbi:putative benzoate 4-monooxygenase cytochrome P450 [Acephala macrosclerotiorum]|nr:putative benzoate 4-monooxygenase cytochrome P450 [Acephala macrosclerotiorum]